MGAKSDPKRAERREQIARRVSGAAVARAEMAPPAGVPIALRSAQHVLVSRGRFEPMVGTRIALIEWVIKGEAALAVGAQRVSFKDGQVAIYLPSIPFHFWAIEEVNEMCWFTVDGPLAEQFMFELELRPGVYPSGPPPVERIQEMMSQLKNHSIQGLRKASLLAVQTLYELADQIRTPQVPSVVREVQTLIEQEFANPDLSAELMAERFAYHRGSLSRLFHHHTGVTIMDYITRVRLQQAKSLLQHTPDKIAEVSRKCGFREASYFCRWVQKRTGSSPTELREASQK